MTNIILSKAQMSAVENAQFRVGILVGFIFAIIVAILGYIIYSGWVAFVHLFLK